MTRNDPSLRLNRLVVFKSGMRAYDEQFKVGVNIIRSEGNSAGKSTIVDLIFFAMGGDLTAWKDEAASCDTVYAELTINGAVVTTRREVSRSGLQPMWLFFGGFDQAIENAADGWQRYSYSRHGERENFSQVIFRLLGLPDVSSDGDSNITIHQLLRLMYVDQMTPPDRIFRQERNDSPLRREVIGDLLCGVYDPKIYPAQLLLRRKNREYDSLSQGLVNLRNVLSRVESMVKLDELLVKQDNVKIEREEILSEIELLKNVRFDIVSTDNSRSSAINGIQMAMEKLNRDTADAELTANQTAFAIQDANQLIGEMERSLRQLKEGHFTSESLGALKFQFCPSCLSPLEELKHEHGCVLCKVQMTAGTLDSRYVRMRNELEMQLRESRRLQERRQQKLQQQRDAAASLQVLRKIASDEFIALNRHYLTDADIEIDRLSIRLGYLDRELIDLDREVRLSTELQALSEQKDVLNKEIVALKDDIKLWEASKKRRADKAEGVVAKLTTSVLSTDVQSEKEFATDSLVYYNFAEDRVGINGKFGFSASSLTVVRNAFHLALLWASCIDKEFLYPRFILMDNIEDKGMTEVRSQNFQREIVRISDELSCEHQIIFTTSMIDPVLDVSNMTVGEKYTFNNKSLKILTES